MEGAAIVLCGGRSRRMGQPKELLAIDGETLLRRVVRLMGTVARRIVIVGAPIPNQGLPEFPRGITVVRDPVFGRGPLQGMVTGLEALPDSIDLVYVTAVDTPFLNPLWIDRLAERIGDHDIAIPFVGGRYHPLSAIYRRARVLPVAQALLELGRLRPTFLTETLRTRVVLEDEMAQIDPGLRSLRNLNTPEEYRAALIDVAQGNADPPPGSTS